MSKPLAAPPCPACQVTANTSHRQTHIHTHPKGQTPSPTKGPWTRITQQHIRTHTKNTTLTLNTTIYAAPSQTLTPYTLVHTHTNSYLYIYTERERKFSLFWSNVIIANKLCGAGKPQFVTASQWHHCEVKSIVVHKVGWGSWLTRGSHGNCQFSSPFP